MHLQQSHHVPIILLSTIGIKYQTHLQQLQHIPIILLSTIRIKYQMHLQQSQHVPIILLSTIWIKHQMHLQQLQHVPIILLSTIGIKQQTHLQQLQHAPIILLPGLKIWEAKRVRSIIDFFHCRKRRCTYSPADAFHGGALVVFQQKLELVLSRCSSSNLLLDDGYHLSNTIMQNNSLNCANPIEKVYYNHNERGLNLKDVCYHYGDLGLTSFLLGRYQLREKSTTYGWNCHLICQDCISNCMKPIKFGKQDKALAKKEKIEK